MVVTKEQVFGDGFPSFKFCPCGASHGFFLAAGLADFAAGVALALGLGRTAAQASGATFGTFLVGPSDSKAWRISQARLGFGDFES